jgi:hypothetical protein
MPWSPSLRKLLPPGKPAQKKRRTPPHGGFFAPCADRGALFLGFFGQKSRIPANPPAYRLKWASDCSLQPRFQQNIL